MNDANVALLPTDAEIAEKLKDDASLQYAFTQEMMQAHFKMEQEATASSPGGHQARHMLAMRLITGSNNRPFDNGASLKQAQDDIVKALNDFHSKSIVAYNQLAAQNGKPTIKKISHNARKNAYVVEYEDGSTVQVEVGLRNNTYTGQVITVAPKIKKQLGLKAGNTKIPPPPMKIAPK